MRKGKLIRQKIARGIRMSALEYSLKCYQRVFHSKKLSKRACSRLGRLFRLLNSIMNTSEERSELKHGKVQGGNEEKGWERRDISRISHLIRPEKKLFHGKLDFPRLWLGSGGAAHAEDEEFISGRAKVLRHKVQICINVHLQHKWTTEREEKSRGRSIQHKSERGEQKRARKRAKNYSRNWERRKLFFSLFASSPLVGLSKG